MSTESVWFSHREEIWKVDNGKFSWTKKNKIWDWRDCTVSFAKTKAENEEKIRVVIRSNAQINSTYLGEHLFTWQNFPEDHDETERLRFFLEDEHKIDWAKKAKFIKKKALIRSLSIPVKKKGLK